MAPTPFFIVPNLGPLNPTSTPFPTPNSTLITFPNAPNATIAMRPRRRGLGSSLKGAWSSISGGGSSYKGPQSYEMASYPYPGRSPAAPLPATAPQLPAIDFGPAFSVPFRRDLSHTGDINFSRQPMAQSDACNIVMRYGSMFVFIGLMAMGIKRIFSWVFHGRRAVLVGGGKVVEGEC